MEGLDPKGALWQRCPMGNEATLRSQADTYSSGRALLDTIIEHKTVLQLGDVLWASEADHV